MTNLKTVLGVAVLGVVSFVHAERVDFDGCCATWGDGRLTVGNTLFERTWAAGGTGLVPVSFLLKNPDIEWVADSSRKAKASGTLAVKAMIDRRSIVGAEGLHLEITVEGRAVQKTSLWLFPKASGVLIEQNGKGGSVAGAETLMLAPLHLRVTEVTLMDQTDKHNELVSEREWLLMPNEKSFDVQGCVLGAENVIDNSGLVFLKLAPLPHARQNKEEVDFHVAPAKRSIDSFFNGYPVAVLGYCGGHTGRTRALHAFQRCLREYRPARDGLFLSNTWGDRSRDARINEAFLLKEVEAGAALGVDVVQIDDGWQKGRSANSASARGKGVWNGYWAADPDFWDADPVRFPNGLEPVVSAARDRA